MRIFYRPGIMIVSILIILLIVVLIIFMEIVILRKNNKIDELLKLKNMLNEQIENRKEAEKNSMESEKKLSRSYQELSVVYEQLATAEQELKQQIAELKNHEEALKISEERYKLAVEGANDAIFEWDFKNDSLFISDKWKSISESEKNKFNGIRDFIRSIVYHKDLPKVKEDLRNHMKGNTDYFQSEFRIFTKNGVHKWLRARGKVLRDDNEEILKMAGSVTDITENKVIQNKINYIAYYDTLTLLPNRARFLEQLDNAITENVTKNHKGAVIFLDVDNFKKINDVLGHDYGDEFLKKIAQILKNFIRPTDILARSGGDEFIILIPKMEDINEILDLSENIINYFKNPFIINCNTIYSSISMGVSIFPEDGINSKDILRNADTAMYEAKYNGRNQYRFFNKAMSENILRKDIIERGLREALEKNELMLYYQPQLDIKNNRISGFEALIRWKSKELGWVSPEEFIAIAEETDLIIPLGNWIIKEACKQIKYWKEKGYVYDSMAINISPLQIQQEDFIKNLTSILQETDIRPENVEIEITENVLMNLYDDNIEFLKRLKDKGFRIALDDFGTGYSSLSYLRLLPINKLKIDKSFIDYLESNEADRDITAGIIELSHKMGLEVIVEGVETQQQLSILKAMDCDSIQGYYFSKPLPTKEVEEFLDNAQFIVHNAQCSASS